MKRFRYAPAGKFFVCVDQSVLSCFQRLWLENRKHGLEGLRVPRPKAVWAIKSLLKFKLGRSDRRWVELPVQGELALPVHNGHKVFDLVGRRVFKVFEAVDPDVARGEFESCAAAAESGWAPRALDHDPGYQWYAEEYLSGSGSVDAIATDLDRWLPQITRCLRDLATVRPHAQVNSKDYLASLLESPFGEGWEKPEAADTRERMQSWLDRVQEKLDSADAPRSTVLVFSHGDFSLVNILVCGDELRVIDWETGAPRSALNDLFNFFAVERYYRRADDDVFDSLWQEATSTASWLESQLMLAPGSVADHLVFYALVYSLERTLWLADRKISETTLRVMNRSIDLFQDWWLPSLAGVSRS